jgi:RNA polymerase sigma-70 factor, ECF subfamily
MTLRTANAARRTGFASAALAASKLASMLPGCQEPPRKFVTNSPAILSKPVDGFRVGSQPVPEASFDMDGCLARVRQRDEDAARLLFQHLYPLVIKLVRSHLPRRTSEEDLAQTVYMKIFAKLDQFSGTVPFEHWVSRIAVNTCLNQLQAERIRPELRWADLTEDEQRVLDALPSATAPLEDPCERTASRDLVNRLLDKLNPEDRLVINLIHLEGRSIEEIRKATGWNTSLIKVRAFRARHKLRKHFRNLMEEKRK